MTKKTYGDVVARIEKLKAEAAKLKAQEVQGVVDRMREAIRHYGLTPADLFGRGAARPAIKTTKKPARKAKYGDGNGNTWHGMGRRPEWLKEALDKGKKLTDLQL